MAKFFVCSCFFTNNYFLPQFNAHFIYNGKEEFLQKYRTFLEEAGLNTLDQRNRILNELDVEYKRRCNLGQESLQRKSAITALYKPLHAHVYTLKESYLAKEFLDLVSYCKDSSATVDGVLARLQKEKGDRIYSFPVFTPSFCEEFLQEILHFDKSDLPKGRPNTMNNYGVLLDEVGFDEGLLAPLRERYLTPLTRLLYPDWGGGHLDSHKAFIVSYSEEHDRQLDEHYDNAEVTLNVALASDFEEGSLYFGSMRTEPVEGYTEYRHRVAYGLLHRGQHRHGAMPITEGERHNLIIWMRCSAVRNQLCPMCDQPPQLVEMTGRGDGFSMPTKEVCQFL